ncbi:MAG TPA: DUF58 domain-containing protein [Thermodesulfobacteriota bacterium]|nr:DUF58 domain-containing protein [Thermodesulfobacteriota bacterium]
MSANSLDRGVPSVFVVPLCQVILGVFLFIALFYAERPLAMLAILVLGLAVGAKVWARASLSGMRCSLSVDKKRAFPDEELTLRISAENRKLLPVWFQVNVPVGGLLRPSSSGGILTNEARLLWYQRAHFQWKLTAQRRGVHSIGPSRLSAGDLFAFFTKTKKTEELHSIIVYPRLVSLKSFSFPKRDFFGVPGAKSPVQDPIYILGTRDYQQGQPAKRIHWKASARHHRLQQKIFEPSEQEKILLVVDVAQFAKNGAENEFEQTLEIVASLALRLDRRGDAVGLLTNGAVVGNGPAGVPISKSNSQLPAILEVLARLRMEPEGDCIHTLRRELEASWGISCVHFSYEEGETVALFKEYYRHHRKPVTFFVCRPGLNSREDKPRGCQDVHRLDDIRMKEDPRNETGI